MQYDVYANPSTRSRERYPYVLQIQTDLLAGLATRMVVPLTATTLGQSDVPRSLCPIVPVQGRALMLVPFEAAPVDKRLLKTKLDSLKAHAHEIVAAMDAVISGF